MEIKYATDLLIFAIDDKEKDNCRKLNNKKLSILLVKRKKDPFKDKWCLPGGFIFDNESSLVGAKRIIKKETNLEDFYLEQLKIFDDVNRDPRGRVVSVAYISLVNKKMIKNDLCPDAKWFDIEISDDHIISLVNNNELMTVKIKKKVLNEEANQFDYRIIDSDLAFDHGLILKVGLDALYSKAITTDIIFNLMPDKFTIGELKQVYEIILNKKLINSAFRRVIAPKIEATDEIIKTGGYRPAQYFRYKRSKINNFRGDNNEIDR